ncbi:hypothetical protein MAR_031961 [Mya arenaria]|uniref:Uncharacterized protein n=1 Tax=Mya arenaria TaxID=6604 RepID=A0ABY7F8M4_MYAAR|nr:hypothetical protein MAR_031961 [Mya arenaria]
MFGMSNWSLWLSYYTCWNTCNNTCANHSCDGFNGQCDQGCVDGYSGPFCNISCPPNCKSYHQDNGECNLCAYDYWGEYCLNNCSENCTHLNESWSSCEIATGECKYGCLHGTHGSFCNIYCDQKCSASEDGVRECRQTDGQCTLGCETGYKLTTTGCIEGKEKFLIKFASTNLDSRADEEARTYEQLQERMEQPNYQNVKDNGTDNYAVLFADINM